MFLDARKKYRRPRDAPPLPPPSAILTEQRLRPCDSILLPPDVPRPVTLLRFCSAAIAG